jgi:hypothetical protein
MRLSETIDPSSWTSRNTTTPARVISRASVGLHIPVIRLRSHGHLFRLLEFDSLLSLSILLTLSKSFEPVKWNFILFSLELNETVCRIVLCFLGRNHGFFMCDY